jgi:hypothetical protein
MGAGGSTVFVIGIGTPDVPSASKPTRDYS